MGLDDGWLGVDEGKIVARVVVNLKLVKFPWGFWCLFQGPSREDVNFWERCLLGGLYLPVRGTFVVMWGIGYLGK